MGNGTRAFAIVNEDNPLRTAEISTEQNYNQIDGIINNQPTVAELEADAKSGKSISLMDLLDATRREEKQSVMEQLAKPPQSQEKSKKALSKGCGNGVMIMSRFTVEESNLMCIYNTGSRAALLFELTEMQSNLQSDETELTELTTSLIDKLQGMNDEDFENLSGELVADFEEQEE